MDILGSNIIVLISEVSSLQGENKITNLRLGQVFW